MLCDKKPHVPKHGRKFVGDCILYSPFVSASWLHITECSHPKRVCMYLILLHLLNTKREASENLRKLDEKLYLAKSSCLCNLRQWPFVCSKKFVRSRLSTRLLCEFVFFMFSASTRMFSSCRNRQYCTFYSVFNAERLGNTVLSILFLT